MSEKRITYDNYILIILSIDLIKLPIELRECWVIGKTL